MSSGSWQAGWGYERRAAASERRARGCFQLTPAFSQGSEQYFLCVGRLPEHVGGQGCPCVLPGYPVVSCEELGFEDLGRWGRGPTGAHSSTLLVGPMGAPSTHGQDLLDTLKTLWGGLFSSHLFYQDLKPTCHPAVSVASGSPPPSSQDSTPGPAFLPLGTWGRRWGQSGAGCREGGEK